VQCIEGQSVIVNTSLYSVRDAYRRNSALDSCRKCHHRRNTDLCPVDEFSLVDTDLQTDRQTDRQTQSLTDTHSQPYMHTYTRTSDLLTCFVKQHRRPWHGRCQWRKRQPL